MSDDFLGSGLSFPFRYDRRTGVTATSTGKNHIAESIFQILMTRKGERFMRPNFGSRLHELVFEQNDQVLKGLIRYEVIEAIHQWEKRVVIIGVAFEKDSGNQLDVRVAYRIIQNQVEGNLVFPFYRAGEGS